MLLYMPGCVCLCSGDLWKNPQGYPFLKEGKLLWGNESSSGIFAGENKNIRKQGQSWAFLSHFAELG